MIRITNKGLNKKGVREINRILAELRELHKNKKWVAQMHFLGNRYYPRHYKNVKVGDIVGYSEKTLKRKSISKVYSIGSYLNITVLLEWVDYKVENI
jgi:hypothetical protein